MHNWGPIWLPKFGASFGPKLWHSAFGKRAPTRWEVSGGQLLVVSSATGGLLGGQLHKSRRQPVLKAGDLYLAPAVVLGSKRQVSRRASRKTRARRLLDSRRANRPAARSIPAKQMARLQEGESWPGRKGSHLALLTS